MHILKRRLFLKKYIIMFCTNFKGAQCTFTSSCLDGRCQLTTTNRLPCHTHRHTDARTHTHTHTLEHQADTPNTHTHQARTNEVSS